MGRSRMFTKASWGFLAYTIGVILWGAFVRASFSGDGCGAHWPLCNGEVIPVDPSRKTLVELTHRLTSGICGIAAFAFFVASLRVFPRGHGARKGAAWTLLLMVTEALIGAGIVKLGMVADNAEVARAYWMALHLVNTFALLAAILVMTYHATLGDRVRSLGESSVALDRWVMPTLWVAVALILATSTAGTVAALGDTLFPTETFAEGFRLDSDANAHAFVRHRVVHPVLAMVTIGYLVALGGALVGRGIGGRAMLLLLSGAVVQFAVGLLNLVWLAPVPMQLVHLFVADAIWLCLIWVIADLRERDSARKLDGVIES